MGSNKNFEYLGSGFQLQLINQMILDKEFTRSIIDVMSPNYFENKYFKLIIQMIKEFYSKYDYSPTFDTLEQIAKSELQQELALKIVLDTIQKVRDASVDSPEFVKEKSMKFCKQQELQKVMSKAQKIIDGGEFENYDKVEQLVRSALQVGEVDLGTTDVFNELEDVLNDDYRHPIPMGIPGIDKLLKGGLAKGEIGVILAPTGTGKALPISEPILTPKGWSCIGDSKEGDAIIGSDGKYQTITGVFPQGIRPIYKVKFTDDTYVNCDIDHLWAVNTINMRESGSDEYQPVKVRDMIGNIKKGGMHNYKLPIISPVDFEYVDIKEDPYLVGSRLPSISFIPDEYKYNSLIIRLSVLQGLFDFHAQVTEDGFIELPISSIELAKDIREIVLSLGGYIQKNSEDLRFYWGGENYTDTSFKLMKMQFPQNLELFRSKSKLNDYATKGKFFNEKYVESIDYSHDEEAICIKVSNHDQLFVTRDYVLTHNTTMLTMIGNHAFNLGYNVLQIFFEDNPKIIQRKHFTLWTKIHPDELSLRKDEVLEKVKIIKESSKNKLILKKLPSDTMTMNQIKNQVRKIIADGTKIDVILLDYIDCVISDKIVSEEWKAEGSTIRAFESMCHELSIAGWTATQGNRCCDLETIVNIENKGLIKIKDVVLGDKILTHDGYKDVTHIFPIQKQPVYSIKTKSGKEIKVSSRHEFPTLYGKLKSISTGLSVGDKLYVKKENITVAV